MSLDNQARPRRDLDFLEGNENNLNNYENFDNIDLRLEDGGNDLYDDLQNYKTNSGLTYRPQQIQNTIPSHPDLFQQASNSGLKYSEYYNQQGGANGSINQSYNYSANGYDDNNDNHIQKQNSYKNGKNTNEQNEMLAHNNYKSLGSGINYHNYQQQQLSKLGKHANSSTCLTQSSSSGIQKQISKPGNSNPVEQEQQKQKKLMNALKSNPQDLEQILEEQEKQQILQKKLKIEVNNNNNNIQQHASSIQLTNYSPTRETLKRVESNTSLNETKQSKNLSKIKGNVKNAYIKKITSLLNIQNPPSSEQNDNFQEPKRNDSDDSDDSEQKSYEKPEDGKKVIKNRESARNSRQRKKIYIELLEKKINELTVQIEEQCVNIEKSQKEICKILDNHNHIKAFVQTRHEYIQKIGDMSYAEKPNNEQLGYILDSLRLRIGAQGTCRQKALSLYFRTIMKYFMQSTFPYLIYGFQQNISEDQEFNRCVEIFKKICNIQDETQVFKFLPHLKKFLECRMNFRDSYQKMKKIRKSVFKREESIERLLDGLSLLHPVQMGKFLKGLDKFRKTREIRLLKKTNSQTTDHYEVDTQSYGKHFPQPDKQLNKLRQQTVQNQNINNKSNQSQLNQQNMQLNYQHPATNIEFNQEMMDIEQQQKNIVTPQNYNQSKLTYTPGYQINLKQEYPQNNQRYMQQQQQNQGLNIQNINNNKVQIDNDQYYHQQPQKKQFYKNLEYNNNAPY